MMVRVSGALLRFTDYQRVISVDAPTVEAALVKLAGAYQPLRKVLFDRQGRVRATQKVFLNGEPLEPEELASSGAGEADCVELLLAISGG
ncbi:MAG TPA: MoaD/ThiS family protein [Candidatus Dormibacteraeota bacterium]|nr:MoaD/ThiS family protein [Candidatus Dormibacteraeota bacterium]